MAKLELSDIVDLRAYERERDEFRARVIALKKKRRVHVGPFVTFVFENADTIRFQIQEMARAEKIMSDEGIEIELAIYNPLIPEPGHLAATMFIELTSDDQLREWLPKLVGIERAVEFRLGAATGLADARVVRCTVDPEHEKQLTRDEITASVHYLHFAFAPDEIEAVGGGPVELAVTHPAYRFTTVLGADTVAELRHDLDHGG